MKASFRKLVTVAVLMSPLAAEAKINTAEKLEQLKSNAENSQANLEQYKDNLNIVNVNLAELNKALTTIKAQEGELQKNTNNADKNKQALQGLEKNLLTYRDEEKQKMADEQKQVDELQAALKKLQDNQTARQSNIDAYNAKLEELRKEKENWNQKSGSLAEISSALDSKKKEVLAERQKWLDKQKSYQKEVEKWDRQAASSDRNYQQFQNLK